ncbi:MAG: hypothetical protein ABI646_00235 [Acidobacteriota bacterium]
MRILLIISILLVSSISVFSQVFPQSERFKRRVEQSVKASEDREHDRRLAESGTLPVPKPAVMNVDVQLVLSKADYKTFAEAKLAEVRKIVDGEPLWLYIKFKSKLGDYVLTTRHPDDPERLRYTLFADIGPRGDVTAQNQYSIQFNKEDLAATELKINLAPGIFGRNKSIPVFLMTSGAAKTGVWNSEFRLTNTVTMPRPLTANLATVPVTLDFAGGPVKYKKMDADYVSITLRGTSDLTKMPIAGNFFNENLRLRITEKLAAENIKPERLYFSGDDWQEFSSFGMAMAKSRKVFATFTYRQGEPCMYGVAEVVENFDFMQSKFGEAEITLQKDLPINCSEVN